MTLPRVSLPAVTSAIPLAAYTVVIAFAAVAASRVGHWPYYSHPDPKDLQLPLLHRAAFFAVLIAHAALLAALCALVVRPQSWQPRHMALLLAGGGLWLFEALRDQHLFIWLID